MNMVKNLTEGRPLNLLFFFALPMVAGNLFQQLYNMVDTAVVGKFVGEDAVAAVGSSFPIVFLSVAVASGLSMGCTVVVSQLFGAGRIHEMKTTISTAIISLGVLGLLIMGLGTLLAGPLLQLLGTDPDIMADSRTYLQIYFGGAVFLFLYNTLNGIYNAQGDSKTPLIFLMISSLTNIVLDLLFVAVFHWGIAGAAIATIVAQALSALLVLGVLTASRSCYRVQWRNLKVQRGILKNIFVVGVPSALQLAVTSFSNVFVQSYVNRFASSCMAGWAAYQKIDAFAILPMTTLSVTATTFVGQNVGAGNWERAKRGIRCSLAIATVVAVVVLVPLMLFARPLCGLFNQEPEVLDYGVYFIRLISPFYLIANFNQIYAGALRGAGDAKIPMFIMLFSFVAFRQVYLLVTYRLFGTLLPVALGYPVGWIVCSVILLLYYRSGKWMKHSFVTS